MLAYVRLIRIRQWTKNLFLFLPMFFAGRLLDPSLLLQEFIGFLSFCLIASFIYVINDIKDSDKDQIHPQKRLRPIASGEISKSTGLIVGIICLMLGGIFAYQLNLDFIAVLAIYLLLNILYTLGLKNISILDIMIISVGFVLRLIGGALIGSIFLSKWIIAMVFLLALFLAVAKRRDDLILKDSTGTEIRKVTKTYSLDFLNIVMSLLCGVIMVAYITYSLSPEVFERMGTDSIFYTSIFVLAGLLRYLQMALVENNTGSPSDILLKDRFIQFSIVLWGLSFYIIIYTNSL